MAKRSLPNVLAADSGEVAAPWSLFVLPIGAIAAASGALISVDSPFPSAGFLIYPAVIVFFLAILICLIVALTLKAGADKGELPPSEEIISRLRVQGTAVITAGLFTLIPLSLHVVDTVIGLAFAVSAGIIGVSLLVLAVNFTKLRSAARQRWQKILKKHATTISENFGVLPEGKDREYLEDANWFLLEADFDAEANLCRQLLMSPRRLSDIPHGLGY